MNKKCLCLTGLMVFLLISFIYCDAEEMNTLKVLPEAVVAQKQASQNDKAALYTPAYPKETAKHLLPNKRGDLLHVAFEKGYIGNGVKLEPVTLPAAYTIEVIVNPSEKQGDYAVVLGNIYGNEEGFKIQHVPKEQNTYAMSFNDGKMWHFSVNFKLRAGAWNYLAVVFGDMKVLQVYVDGTLIGTVTTKNKIMNTSRPLVIGNWEHNSWPFSGKIAEVRIGTSELSEKDISMRWDRIKPWLSKM